jgi:AraC-like DNA-binding protein
LKVLLIADLLVRGAAIGASLLVALLLFSNRQTRSQSLSACALAITTASYLMVSGLAGPALPVALVQVLVAGALVLPLAFAWLVLDIFLDAPRDRRPWLFLAAFNVPAAVAAETFPAFAAIRGVLIMALYLGLLYLALSTARDDLVEQRRKFRPVFVVITALLGVIITLVELSGSAAGLPQAVYPAQAAVFLILALLLGTWSLTPNPGIWDRGAPDGKPEPGLKPAADVLLIAQLRQVLAQEVWRREGLTIGDLAAELHVPEYRLRLAINRDMGFRNFSTLINGYRIDAAKAALTSPDKQRHSILQIAYDCGFASLGPFNKAFRAQTGQSPRDYRRSAAGNSSSISE